MFRTIQAAVTSYDDITTPQGEVLTMYMIQVQYSSKSTYCIAKRYSDFSTLYQNVKDIVSADYKFPNKSMFNNSAQFTKERRRKGFNELLQLLIQMEPLPEEVQIFLEMRERIHYSGATPHKTPNSMRQSQSARPSTMSPNATNRASTTVAESAAKAETDAMEEMQAKKKLLHLSNFILKHYQTNKTEEVKESEIDVNAEIQKIMPKIARISVQVSAVLYLGLILVGVVDVSHSSYAQILYTYGTMVMIGCFLQIRDARNSMINKSS